LNSTYIVKFEQTTELYHLARRVAYSDH